MTEEQQEHLVTVVKALDQALKVMDGEALAPIRDAKQFLMSVIGGLGDVDRSPDADRNDGDVGDSGVNSSQNEGTP